MCIYIQYTVQPVHGNRIFTDVFAPIFSEDSPILNGYHHYYHGQPKAIPRPSFTGKYGHSPRVGETFCGQARHFIHGLQPTQSMGKPEKACRMSKTLQNQNPSMTPNLDGLLQSHLMRVNGFHLTINRPANQSQQQPRCLHFGWGLKSSVLCKKKRKTVNVFWFL